jgi:fido (protein-threonine AMPylation protein)
MNDFDQYIKQGEPQQQEKSRIWQTAIGLQQVDGLTPSGYLIDTAKQNIEGEITLDEVKKRIDSYYKTQATRTESANDRTEEADKVAANIAEILSEHTFSFTPTEYLAIHRRLFSGIYKFAGKIRDYNITKSEWVLNGKTVYYVSALQIMETLEYDFRMEKRFTYKGLTLLEQIHHIAQFIAELWQIHAFGEGNTRTTAVFAIKYLRTFGFKVENDMFADHSWYFRNALVRANYNDYSHNIYATREYLNRFFENLLLGENHVLSNRELNIDFHKDDSANHS